MEFLQKISNIFGGINIQTKMLLASFIATIILGFIVIPILKKLKIGQVVRDDGPQSHLKKSGTPTMGGINATSSCSNVIYSFLEISCYITGSSRDFGIWDYWIYR